MNKKGEREKYITALLKQKEQVTVTEVAQIFNVSEVTVRRLFQEMERKGLGIRGYGSLHRPDFGKAYSFDEQAMAHNREKRRIGQLAVSCINDGETIYLDGGTTVFEMTLALLDRLEAKDFHSLNIFTNSIVNLQALGSVSGCKVILVGGEYSVFRRDISGVLAEQFISPFHFDKCFFGCDGMTEIEGFSTKDITVSSLNACIMRRCDFVAVLCDSSKFGRAALVSYARLDEIDCLITDAQPRLPLADLLRRGNVKLMVGGNSASPDAPLA